MKKKCQWSIHNQRGFSLLELSISTLFIAGLALSTVSLIQQSNEFSNQVKESSALEGEMTKFNRAIRLPKNCALNFHNLKLFGSPGEAFISSIHYKVTSSNGDTVLDPSGKPIVKTLFQSAHPLDINVVEASAQFINDIQDNFIAPTSQSTTTTTTLEETSDTTGNNPNNEEEIETSSFDGNEFEVLTESHASEVISKQILIDGDPESQGNYNLASRENLSDNSLDQIHSEPIGPSKPFSKNYFVESIRVVKVEGSQSVDNNSNNYYTGLQKSAFKVFVRFKAAGKRVPKQRLKEVVRIYKFEAYYHPNTNRIICNNRPSQDVIDLAIQDGCDEMNGNYVPSTGRCLLPSYEINSCDQTQQKFLSGFSKDAVTNTFNLKCQNITDLASELNTDYGISFSPGSTCASGQVPFAIQSGLSQYGWPKVVCQSISYSREYEPLFGPNLISGCTNYLSLNWDFTDPNFIFPQCN